MKDIFAVFVVARATDHQGMFAATTRAKDRGESGRIGLPGGKVDEGESLVAAALREASEEGWDVVGLNPSPIHTSQVDGKHIAWLEAEGASVKETFKEEGRIRPVAVPLADIAQSGWGNDFLWDRIKIDARTREGAARITNILLKTRENFRKATE